MSEGFRAHLRNAITITHGMREGRPWTTVTIAELRIPNPEQGGVAWIRVTTELSARLSRTGFEARAARKINAASEEKGRVVYAIALDVQEVVAAVSYHLPSAHSAPLQITALAPRIDSLAVIGRAAIPILKTCVHEIARAMDRPTKVTLQAHGVAAEEAIRYYGFRRGRAPFRQRRVPPGSDYLVQSAPHL